MITIICYLFPLSLLLIAFLLAKENKLEISIQSHLILLRTVKCKCKTNILKIRATKKDFSHLRIVGDIFSLTINIDFFFIIRILFVLAVTP